MAFPRKLLNDNEQLVLDLKPHWVYLVPAVARLAAAIVLGILVLVYTHDTTQNALGIVVGVLVLVMLIWLIARYVKWVSTQFVVTGDRIISRRGVFAKSGLEIPLERINSVQFSQRVIERLVGAGDLTIESASDAGRESFSDIRNPSMVQREIYVQMEANSHRPYEQLADRHADAISTLRGQGGTSAPSVAEELSKLDELRRNGVLSEAEFQAQKARLLDH